jgi:hypothetical protein
LKITALRLFNVKRFAGRGIAIEGIGEGVNVLCAANEVGKSTSFEALHALFFQPHSGTPGDVQRLRPYSGGSPLVEADVLVDDAGFRITKQYYGGRSAQVCDLATGRVIAQADEAERFIADLTRGGANGPGGLLWVRQGLTGIEKRSKPEEDSERQIRKGLLESVQGEVEAVTGGRRMGEIITLTASALGALVTPTGKPKTGERYAAAIELRDRLQAEERQRAAELSVLREALTERTTAARRLAEIDQPEDRAERRKAVEAAEAAFDAAKAQGEALNAAQAQSALAQARRDAAREGLEVFRSAQTAARELEGKRREAGQRRGEAIARRDAAVAAIEAARKQAEAAEADEQAARDLLVRLDAATRAREAAERLEGLRKRLADAEAVELDIRKAKARLAIDKLPATAIDELERLEVGIAKERALAEAGSPTVAIAYKPDAVHRVSMDSTPLEPGVVRRYDALATLEIPGIGLLTLRSNRPAGRANELAALEDKRATLLSSMGLDSLQAARKRQIDGERMEVELKGLGDRLALLAPQGLARLREEVAKEEVHAAEPAELEADPADVRGTLADAVAQRKSARLALLEAEPIKEGADAAFVAAETALAENGARCDHVDAILGPAVLREARAESLAEALETLARTASEAMGAALDLSDRTADLASAEAALKRARSVEQAVQSETGLLREKLAALNAEIRARSDDAVEEMHRETSEALLAAEARVAGFADEVAVLERLSAALETSRSNAREQYLKPVITELRPLLRLLFDDVSIVFDEKTLLPDRILRKGLEEDIERLSGGMREQLSVLTRLAFARLLAKGSRPTPVILDDALVYSDDDRIEKMFDALHRQARDQQIIVFSCRQRAFQKLGGHLLRMDEWRPRPS